jgi:hypothetical protein
MLKRDKNISKQTKAKDRKSEIQNAKKTSVVCVWIKKNLYQT